MKLSQKEIQDLIDNIKYHVIDKYQGTDYDEDEDEYLYNGKMYWYKATFETLEYETFIEAGEYSHVECGHREMTLDDVDVHELSVENKEGDLEIIF